MTTKYEIKFKTKAIISIIVKADDLDEAKKMAQEILNNTPLYKSKKIEVLDCSEEYCGFDNLDLWEI